MKLLPIKKAMSFVQWFCKERLVKLPPDKDGRYGSSWSEKTTCEIYFGTDSKRIAKEAWKASRRCFARSKNVADLKKQLSKILHLSGMTSLKRLRLSSQEVAENLKELTLMSNTAHNLFSKIEQGLRK